MTRKSLLSVVFAGLTLVPGAASAYPSGTNNPNTSTSRLDALRQRIGNRLGLGGGSRSLLNRRSAPTGATRAAVGAAGAHFVEPGTRVSPNGTQISAHGIRTIHAGDATHAALYTQRIETSGRASGAPHVVSEHNSVIDGHTAITSHATSDGAGNTVRNTTVAVTPPGGATPGPSRSGARAFSNGTRETFSHTPAASTHQITHADGSGTSRVTNHEAGFTNTRVQYAAGSGAQLHASQTVLHSNGAVTIHSSGRAGAGTDAPVYHDTVHFQPGSRGAQAYQPRANR